MKKQNLLWALLLSCTFPTLAYDFVVDGIYYKILSEDAVEVTNSGEYNCYSGDVIIPDNVTYNAITYRVTTIGEYAFYDCSNLLSIKIGSSIKTIGIAYDTYSFFGCNNLEYIEVDKENHYFHSTNNCLIRDTLYFDYGFITSSAEDAALILGCKNSIIPQNENILSISAYAFYNCKDIESLTIPETVTNIGIAAFKGCTNLKSINIPETITEISESLLEGCTSLEAITIPSQVIIINKAAFKDSGLKSIEIPNNVIDINEKVFYNCSQLSDVTIGKKVYYMADSVFHYCNNLKSITWNAIRYENFVNMKEYLFGQDDKGTSKIQTFIFGDSVKIIPKYLCYNLSAIESIHIPSSVTNIGEYAFFNCKGLKAFTLGENITNMEGTNFQECKNLTTINWNAKRYETDLNFYEANVTNFTFGDSVEYIPANLCKGMTEIASIKIPNSVTQMGESAFEGCTKMRTLHIGDGLTEFPSKAFAGCTGLLNLTVRAEMPPYLQANTFDKVSKSLLVHVPCTSVNSYKAAYYWNEFTNYQESFLLDFLVKSANPEQGSTLILQHPTCEDITATFKALPVNGYIFKEWNDGNTDNPRTISVVEDVEYVAYFEKGETGELKDATIEPTDNAATFSWPIIEGAASYVLIIWANEQQTEKFCTLTFNAEGQLTNIDFSHNAPAKTKDETPTNGLSFTVTGLSAGTAYAYTLSSYDSAGILLDSATGTFTTTTTNALEDITTTTPSVRKVLHNGTIYILKPNGNTFTIDGRKVN